MDMAEFKCQRRFYVSEKEILKLISGQTVHKLGKWKNVNCS
jgi:hypothetical protein